MLPPLMNYLRSRITPTAPRTRRPRRRPSLEALEDRLVPAVFNPLAGISDGDPLSLRAAILAANTNGEDNTINLQAGHYVLTLANTNGHRNDGSTGNLSLTSTGHTVVFQGAGADVTVIDANHIDRAFEVLQGVTVVFKDLSITGGLAKDAGVQGQQPSNTDAFGGAILNQGGNVTLDHVILGYNQALGSPAAMGSAGYDAEGGAIWTNGGSLTITDSTLESNAAYASAGESGSVNGVGIGGNGTAGGSVRAAPCSSKPVRRST